MSETPARPGALSPFPRPTEFPIGKFRFRRKAQSQDFSRSGNCYGQSWKIHAIFPIGKNMAKRTLTPTDIGLIVRTTRKAQGLRQDQLAGAAGVGLRFIVDLEAGKSTAQIGKTLQVLEALGCSLRIAAPPERKA